MLAYSPTGFDSQAVPSAADSAKGQALLAAHYPTAESDPTDVLFRLPASVWDDPAVLTTATDGLRNSGQFTSVTGALDPNGTAVTAADLADAHRQLAAYGPAGDLPGRPAGRVHRDPGRLRRLQGLRRLHQFRRPDPAVPDLPGRRVLHEHGGRLGHAGGAGRGRPRWAGRSGPPRPGWTAMPRWPPTSAALSMHDLLRIIPIVMLVLGILLGIVLRSLVAPLYLVASVALSYLASLGFAVLVFVVIGGQDGINFVLPFFMFIFIMALGQDYNILVMTRIREEAHFAPIKTAVRHAVEATGTTVTSAGVILAGTFGVLTATGDTQIVEIGVGLAAGILLDTFFVRTLLVPSVVVLLGRWNWWPSHLSHEDRDHGTHRPGPEWPVRQPHGARPDGRAVLRTEYGERAWPADPNPLSDPRSSSSSATGRRRRPARCSPAGPPGSTCPTRAGPGRGGGRADRRPGRGERGGPVAVYASPLERTSETARPIARALGLRVRSDRGLLECDFGEWTGKKLADLAKKPEWTTVQRNPSGFRFPGGESFLEMQTRMASALARLVALHPGRRSWPCPTPIPSRRPWPRRPAPRSTSSSA